MSTSASLRRALTPAARHAVIEIAGRAPSVHNSQPWRFRFDGDVLELRADAARALAVTDPGARELVLSCGAALYNARVALREHGLDAVVHRAPNSQEPLLLARVVAVPGRTPSPDDRRMLAATVHRHTHRQGFDPVPLSVGLVAALEAEVAAEGASISWVRDPAALRAVVDLAQLADDELADDAGWQRETAHWVDDTGTRRDGMPVRALAAHVTAIGALPPRSFAQVHPAVRREGTAVAGLVGVLLTDGDGLVDWIDAGQALQRMLLRAADSWVFATYATAALEVPHSRASLRELMGGVAYPQMLFELGHAGHSRPTPRRSVDDLIDP